MADEPLPSGQGSQLLAAIGTGAGDELANRSITQQKFPWNRKKSLDLMGIGKAQLSGSSATLLYFQIHPA